MAYRASLVLTGFSLLVMLAAYRSATQLPDALSPEGCRMSYMWPSYVLQTEFNSSWTPLSRRYTLWLYREAGWEKPDELHGVPVLFIPGNAGSSKQARSIASSACRQYFTSPNVPSEDFFPKAVEALDVYTAEFNEDLSAFHGPTLLAQSQYVSDAIKYILSKYRPGTKILVMGHSMGGTVAMSLLPSSDISAVITMSTPHTLPPARFDKRIERIFAASMKAGKNDSTPVLSICGGATDLMIPSESCILPPSSGADTGFRKTIFTSGMDGVWSGVGHQSMVWCHQVRWRVARAALEIGATQTPQAAARVLDTWFRNEASVSVSSSSDLLDLKGVAHSHVEERTLLVLRPPQQETSAYIFKAPSEGNIEFTLLASGASVAGVGPQKPSWTKIDVLSCVDTPETLVLDCLPVQPTTVRLLAMPKWGRPFPAPKEGADESEGVVVFRASLSAEVLSSTRRQIVLKTDLGWSEAWVVAKMDTVAPVKTLSYRKFPFIGTTGVALDSNILVQDVHLSFGVPTSLLTYSLRGNVEGTCGSRQMPPVALHQSSMAELHLHPLYPRSSTRIHSHASGPFIPRREVALGTELTVLTTGDCVVSRIDVSVDWWHSLGIWATRYWGAIATWGVGIVAIAILRAWSVASRTGSSPSLSVTLDWIGSRLLPGLAASLSVLAIVPLPVDALLGNSGDIRLALLPALVTVAAFTYVVILALVMKGLSLLLGSLKSLLSMAFIVALVAFVIPYQVAYVVFLVDFLWSCAIFPHISTDATSQREHVLLLLLILLPLQAPVLPVWVRTLLTAGYTTPFNGDHNVLSILPMMILVGFSPPNPRALLWEGRRLTRAERAVTILLLLTLAVYPFLFGARWMFGLYDIANVLAGWLVIVRYGGALLRK
ncbi:PGAP1-domain-containing protein [Exidia glandulosa HHB12029]|uniref:GPI inositol-deacylase n=1 Tax=Exidia glandulosa HHB12029 TaxID=1314781 RepID=A0A165R121_EXIGL|nr:PGAP1-domain-containing protein [Exidia glandulosa HHB12029]